MVTIGNDTLPGTITTIESAPSSGVATQSPGVPVIVGQGYLQGSSASASADTGYRISRPSRARSLFGDTSNSQLTRAVQDALAEGAYPVYAVAPSEVEVTAEDLSGESGQTATLANAPVQEVAGDITFTVNSTQKTTILYREGDPANASPGTDEVYLNPQTGKFKVDESLGNAGDEADYWYLDFSNTFDEISNYQIDSTTFLREVVDFIGLVDENDSVVQSAETQANDMESNGNYVIALAGAGSPYIDDAGTTSDETTGYTDSYDNSRLQLINPSRNGDGNTTMGSYAGLRSEIGISTTPIFQSLTTQTSLQTNLSQTQQENLVNSQVIPLEERSGGARIIEDVTTVTDSNTDEANWRQGISRLVTDYVAEAVRDEAEPFIGEFNDTGTLNSLRGNVSSELKALLETRQLEAFSLVVEEVDSTTAAVDVGINTADPLRNIELTVAAGAVSNGVRVEG